MQASTRKLERHKSLARLVSAGVDCGAGACEIRDKAPDAFDKGRRASNQAKDGLVCAFLGASVVFLSVFLVGKKERDTDSEGWARVILGCLSLVAVQKGDSGHTDWFCSAWLGSRSVLA